MAHGHKHPLTMPERLLAGGTAGIVEVLCMYPLDVVKTRWQLDEGIRKGSLWNTLKDMARTDGIRMYRGIVPPILVEAPKRAVKFAANSTYEPYFVNKEGKLTNRGAAMAGSLTGITEAVVVVPFELVKIHMQDKNNAGLYKNTMDATLKIARAEGPLAFYKGLESTMWRNGFWNGGYFATINVIKGALPQPKTQKGTILRDFVAGALAGTVGTTLNTPFDVVKSRIQNQDARVAAGGVKRYNWTLPGLVTVAKEEGIAALYKGYVPKVVRLGPGGGIMLVVNNIVTRYLLNRKEKAKLEVHV